MLMGKLQDQLLSRFNINKSSGISMRLRLYLFLFILVLTMAAGVIVILLVTGTFTAGIKESKQLITRELNRASQEISKQYGQLSVQTETFSRELSAKIEDNLKKQSISFDELADHPEQIKNLIDDLYEYTYFSLQKSKSSGAFLILNTTVNTSLENSENSKAGLYLKNMEPNIVSASNPSFTMLRGISEIGRSHSVDLHTQWSMEFTVKNADYYYLPIQTALEHPDINLSRLYYWDGPFMLPGNSEEIMVCTIPIISSNGSIYGVCGFDISSMLFKLTHMPSNDTYSRMFCMLAPLEDSLIFLENSMLAGGYSVKEISEEYKYFRVRENEAAFTTYIANNGTSYLGFHMATQLYPSGSPYPEQGWTTAILVPRQDILNSIQQLNIILASLLVLLITAGILISILISNKYLKPISQGIEIIKSDTPGEAPKTKVHEIDDLINYLSDYKKEYSKKVERDKYQISMLEQFVSKTKTLSPAERSVFNYYMKGLSAKEIAGEMFLSINTIKTHSKRIFAKLEVASREELLLYINMLKEIGLDLN